MQGYWGKPELTAQTLRDGWVFSGDIGYLDDEGYLYLVDRKKDMIDSGGVKVYPRDIEDIAAATRRCRRGGVRHPARDAGRNPAGRRGAESRRRRHGDGTARLDQRAGCRALPARAGGRHPAAFPRSAAGKTLKRELREPWWAGRTTKI
jgi:long-chain acyl-CoA synthetase